MKIRLHGLLVAGIVAAWGCADHSDEEETGADTQIASQETIPACSSDAGSPSGSDAGPAIKPDAGAAIDAGASGCAALTYDSFGKAFTQKYCVGCHQGATASDGIDLSTLAGVKKNKREVDAHAVKTPRSKPMPPPGLPQPTADERKKLGEWLTCGPN